MECTIDANSNNGGFILHLKENTQEYTSSQSGHLLGGGGGRYLPSPRKFRGNNIQLDRVAVPLIFESGGGRSLGKICLAFVGQGPVTTSGGGGYFPKRGEIDPVAVPTREGEGGGGRGARA